MMLGKWAPVLVFMLEKFKVWVICVMAVIVYYINKHLPGRW